MKNTELWKQFGRMFLSGTVSTALAILSERRFGHWWAGLIGIPIALLTCDVNKSWNAIQTVWQTLSQSVSSARSSRTGNILETLSPKVVATAQGLFGSFVSECLQSIGRALATGGRRTLAFLATWASLIPFFMTTTLLITAVSGFKVEPLGALIINIGMFGLGTFMWRLVGFIDYEQEDRPFFFLSWCMCRLPKTNLFEIDGTGEIESRRRLAREATRSKQWDGRLRDQEGRLFSWSELKKLFLENTVMPPLCFGMMAMFSLLIPVLIIDAILAVFLVVAVSRSISTAAGVVIGFSVDYLFCPHGAAGLASFEWFISCSLLGGLSGLLIWIAKVKIVELARRVALTPRTA